MITSSIMIMGFTTVASWIMKLIAMKMQGDKDSHDAMIQGLNAQAKVTHEARQVKDKGFQWTRRIIALTFTACVVAIPMLVWPYAMVFNDIPPDIFFGYHVTEPGFWPFFSDKTVTEWRAFGGMVITPWHTDMFAYIMGLYFGDRLGGPNGR